MLNFLLRSTPPHPLVDNLLIVVFLIVLLPNRCDDDLPTSTECYVPGPPLDSTLLSDDYPIAKTLQSRFDEYFLENLDIRECGGVRPTTGPSAGSNCYTELNFERDANLAYRAFWITRCGPGIENPDIEECERIMYHHIGWVLRLHEALPDPGKDIRIQEAFSLQKESTCKIPTIAKFSDLTCRQHTDGPALRSLALLRYAEYLMETNMTALTFLLWTGNPDLHRGGALVFDLDWIAANWSTLSCGLWGDTDLNYKDFFWNRAVLMAAMGHASRFAVRMDDLIRAQAYQKAHDEMENTLSAHWVNISLKAGTKNRTFLSDISKNPVDSSVLLGLAILADSSEKIFPPNGYKVAKTIEVFTEVFCGLYDINTRDSRRDSPVPGVLLGRHPGDVRGGEQSPWVITTVGLAELYYLAAYATLTQTWLEVDDWNAWKHLLSILLPQHHDVGDVGLLTFVQEMFRAGDGVVDRILFHLGSDEDHLHVCLDAENGDLIGCRDPTWAYAALNMASYHRNTATAELPVISFCQDKGIQRRGIVLGSLRDFVFQVNISGQMSFLSICSSNFPLVAFRDCDHSSVTLRAAGLSRNSTSCSWFGDRSLASATKIRPQSLTLEYPRSIRTDPQISRSLKIDVRCSVRGQVDPSADCEVMDDLITCLVLTGDPCTMSSEVAVLYILLPLLLGPVCLSSLVIFCLILICCCKRRYLRSSWYRSLQDCLFLPVSRKLDSCPTSEERLRLLPEEYQERLLELKELITFCVIPKNLYCKVSARELSRVREWIRVDLAQAHPQSIQDEKFKRWCEFQVQKRYAPLIHPDPRVYFHANGVEVRCVKASHVQFFLPSQSFKRGEHIGGGGYGTVYEGLERRHGYRRPRKVAIKRQLVDPCVDSCRGLRGRMTLTQFEKELQTMSDLDHKNVLKCDGAFFDLTDTKFRTANIVLEFCECDLYKWRKDLFPERTQTGEKSIEEEEGEGESPERRSLTSRDKLLALTGIAQGMEHIHGHNFVHRDISPRNVLVKEKKRDGTMKICDFGFATDLKTAKTVVMGKLPYIPPEAVPHRGEEERNVRLKKRDVYSFGMLVGFVWSGKDPVERSSLYRLPSFVPDPEHAFVKELALRCVSLNVEDRPLFPEIVSRLTEGLRTHRDVRTREEDWKDA